jgi:membrane-associated phospholipid phosphatase
MYFPSWAKNILFLLVFMISGLILVIIIEGLLSGTELLPLNTAIEQAVTHMRTPLLTNLMVMITNLASPFTLASIAGFVAVMLAVKKDTYNAAMLLASMFVAIISFVLLKNIFQITRPPSDIFAVDGWSFPSGHATVATAFFFIMAHSFIRKVKTSVGRILLVVASIVGAGLVSFSRLYLGAHWALDILAGVALGLLAVSFTVLVFNIFPDKWRFDNKSFN